MGVIAASLLLELLSGAAARTQTIPTAFKSSASVGPVRGNDDQQSASERMAWSFC